MVSQRVVVRSLALVLFSVVVAKGNTVSLDLGIFASDQPIRSIDTIGFVASTSFYVFPDTAYEVTSEFLVDGSTIQWDMSSRRSADAGLTIVLPFVHNSTLDPLPPGDYTLNATWEHELLQPLFPGIFPPVSDLLGGVTGGTGQLEFTVVAPKPGDADGDGVITLLDLDILGDNYGRTPADFSQGDFNGDGVVDLIDLDLLGEVFGGPDADAVPEPAAIALLLGAAATVGVRRASRQA